MDAVSAGESSIAGITSEIGKLADDLNISMIDDVKSIAVTTRKESIAMPNISAGIIGANGETLTLDDAILAETLFGEP